MEAREAASQARELRGLIEGLMAQPGEGGGDAADELHAVRELAFVITDLEGSTAQANAGAAAFAKAQEIHDSVRSLPSHRCHALRHCSRISHPALPGHQCSWWPGALLREVGGLGKRTDVQHACGHRVTLMSRSCGRVF